MSKESYKEGYDSVKDDISPFDSFVNPVEDPDSEDVKDRKQGEEDALNEDPLRMP